MSPYDKDHLYPSGRREIAFIAVGLAIALLSLAVDCMGTSVGWFQRSGALLVLLGAVCESRYVQKVIAEDVVAMGQLSRRQKYVLHSGFLMALAGTLVWGYGDLLVNAITV